MGVTRDEVRGMALGLPHACEGDDHGTPAFTVAGKIFCTLSRDAPQVTIKLSQEDQDNLAAGHPGAIEAVAGYWGRKGWTVVWHEKLDEATLAMLLSLTWSQVAPKAMVKASREAM